MVLSFLKGKDRSLRSGLCRAILCACFLLSLAATSAPCLAQRQEASPQPAPTRTAAPVAPAVEFQSLPGQDTVGRGEHLTIYLFVSNKSNMTLGNLKLNASDPAFETVTPPSFPATLPPFGSTRDAVVLKARDDADFTPHKLLLTLEYAWEIGGGKEAVSAQAANVAVHVKRRFDEESKGFPGGTAAFLYLLLPIIPAILGYQFFETLRKEKVVRLPTFKAEFIVPAFFAAVILNFLMLLAFNQDKGLNYSDPYIFLGVLGVSLSAGAIVPGIRLIINARRMKRWGFDHTDTLQSYLHKALLSPVTPRKFRWATGEADGEQWAGVLLKQPDGTTGLGMQLQVSLAGNPETDEHQKKWEKFTQSVLDTDGMLMDRRELVRMVEAKELTLSPLNNVRRGEEFIDEPVVVTEVRNFKQTDSEEQPLVVASH